MGNECNYLSACHKAKISDINQKEIQVDIAIDNTNQQLDSSNNIANAILNTNTNTNVNINTNNKSSNKDVSLERMKSYFNKNKVNINLANKHKSVVVSYGIILQRILQEKHFKSKNKRKKTIRNSIEIRENVQELLKERELEIQKEKFLHQRNQIKSDESSTNTTTNSISPLNSSQILTSHSQKLSNTQIEFILKTLYDKGFIPQSAVNDYRLNSVFTSIEHKTFPPFTDLYNKGNQIQFCLIVETGCVEYKIDDEYNYLVAGEVFSTDILEKNSEIDCNARTVENSQIYFFELTEDIKKVISSVNFHLKIKDEKIKMLLRTPVFKALEVSKLDKISKAMKKIWFPCLEEIVLEKAMPESCYFLTRGSITCKKDNSTIKKLNPVSLFGEIGLFYPKENEYTYISESESIVYKLDYSDIKDILGNSFVLELITKMFIYQIKKSEQMSKFLNLKHFNQLFNLFQLKYYYNDIVSSYQKKNVFVIISGRIYLNKTKEIIGNSGDFISEYLLNSKRESNIEIIGENECIVFEANWRNIIKTMMCSSLPNEPFYPVMRILKTLSQFKQLTEWKLFQLTDVITLQEFKDKEIIIKNGPQSDKLYIIKSGRVNTSIKEFNIKVCEAGEAFGDISSSSTYASSPIRRENLQTVYTSFGDTICYVIEKEMFDEITEVNHTLVKYDKPFECRDVTFGLDEVYFIKEIGSGGYGKVSLVHNTNNVYAAKSALIKSKNTKTLRYYVNEKNIMGELHHPLIVKIINTFKTSFHLYFLLEFIEGMTLSKYIKKRPKFTALRNLAETQFVGACFFSVVNYLQRMRIIHRDIKPSNCIINTKGYIKIIDFGIAKDLTGKDKTKTVIGTTQYLSPEMLQGKGYSFSVDYWAIGVLLFKFYYGSVPFGEGEADVMKIYNEISNKPLSLPSDDKSIDFNNLISGLLCKNPSKRITSLRQVKQTAMYQQFDFEELNQLKKKSPFIINIKPQRIDYKDTAVTLKNYVENEMMSQGDSDFYCSEKSNEYIEDF